MRLERLKEYLLDKPGATEGTAWGPEHLVYKVMGKLFAVVAWDEQPVAMSLKCHPDRIDLLREVFGAVTPAPYFNKRHWNRIVLDGTVPDDELRAMIDDSYDLVCDKLTRVQKQRLLRLDGSQG